MDELIYLLFISDDLHLLYCLTVYLHFVSNNIVRNSPVASLIVAIGPLLVEFRLSRKWVYTQNDTPGRPIQACIQTDSISGGV